MINYNEKEYLKRPVHMYNSHFELQQKITQHRKSTVFQIFFKWHFITLRAFIMLDTKCLFECVSSGSMYSYCYIIYMRKFCLHYTNKSTKLAAGCTSKVSSLASQTSSSANRAKPRLTSAAQSLCASSRVMSLWSPESRSFLSSLCICIDSN